MPAPDPDAGRPAGVIAAVGTQPADSAEADRQEAALALPEEAEPRGYDETAESAFRAEALSRGEKVQLTAVSATTAEIESGPLPALDELVQRIPGDVRAVLDELFRAKFVAVRRIPKQTLDVAPR